MSETSETKGRCRREMEEHYADKQIVPNQRDWILADGIDRLAADVAEIKARGDRVALEDVRHFIEADKAWVSLVEEKRDAAIRERDEARAEVERLNAELAARPAAAGWLTERERHVLSSMLSERPGDWSLRTLRNWADDILPAFRSILARAGSPPVVEVPVMPDLSVAARVEAQCYRDALDKAGVPWREVARE